MVDEVLTHLEPERGGWYLDGTTGGGGHAAAILERGELAAVVGLDRDPDAINAARESLAGYEGRARLREADFRDAPEILPTLKIDELQGALLDLGVSSYQLDKTARGFSFRVVNADGRDNGRTEARSRLSEHGSPRGAGSRFSGVRGGAAVAGPRARGRAAKGRAPAPRSGRFSVRPSGRETRHGCFRPSASRSTASWRPWTSLFLESAISSRTRVGWW